MKVLETSRNQLAHELESGSVQIVSDGPLLLRAMDAVIAELREALTSIRAAKAPPEPAATDGEGAPETQLTPG